MAEDDFRVELEAYAGPMDLLLYLVQREEVDVHDIPVARILEKYLEAIRAAPALDLDRAGEFLVMASTLLAIKSAMLLPAGDPEMGEVLDPREDLVRQIIEYRRVKEAGQALRGLQEQAALRFPRGRAPIPETPGAGAPEPPGVREATLYDVFAAFHRLLRETEAGEPRRIRYDEVPLEAHADRILAALGAGGGRCGLAAVLAERRDRPFVLGTFLAILELMKEGKVLAVHADAGGEIEIVLQDSDAGRASAEILRERARRLEAETPEGKPGRRPPWKRADAPPVASRLAATGEPESVPDAPPGRAGSAAAVPPPSHPPEASP